MKINSVSCERLPVFFYQLCMKFWYFRIIIVGPTLFDVDEHGGTALILVLIAQIVRHMICIIPDLRVGKN